MEKIQILVEKNESNKYASHKEVGGRTLELSKIAKSISIILGRSSYIKVSFRRRKIHPHPKHPGTPPLISHQGNQHLPEKILFPPKAVCLSHEKKPEYPGPCSEAMILQTERSLLDSTGSLSGNNNLLSLYRALYNALGSPNSHKSKVLLEFY